jgi:hypothetical protein
MRTVPGHECSTPAADRRDRRRATRHGRSGVRQCRVGAARRRIDGRIRPDAPAAIGGRVVSDQRGRSLDQTSNFEPPPIGVDARDAEMRHHEEVALRRHVLNYLVRVERDAPRVAGGIRWVSHPPTTTQRVDELVQGMGLSGISIPPPRRSMHPLSHPRPTGLGPRTQFLR